MSYTSKDFSSVPSTLGMPHPGRMLHAQVLDKQSRVDHAFSKERRHPVAVVDLPSRTMSMTIGVLEPRQSTRRHRHSYETLIYIVSGEGYSEIDGHVVDWRAGDAVYIPVWAWHRHVNTGKKFEVKYVACENAPLLQNLGGLAVREESKESERDS